MPKVFVDNQQSVSRPGVYAIEQSPPRIIRGISNGYIGYIGKSAWGPVFTGYLPESGDDLLKTYEPAGSPRTSTFYYGLMQRLSATWFICRILGTGYATALLARAGTGGGITGTAKYPGALGNSIAWTIAAASNGDATMRDLTFTLTDPTTKTTKEIYRNVPITVAPVDVSKSRLLGSLVFTGTMTVWPASATANLATGSDGAATGSADYQTALDQLVLEDNVRIVVTDDPGDTIRAATNANVVAHCVANANRVCFLMGNQGNTWAQVKTDKASYVSDRVSYCGNWIQVYDDGGVLQTSPLATMIATVRNQIGVHLSVARRDDATLKYFQNVKGIVAAFSPQTDTIMDEATTNGVMLSFKVASGRYGLLHGRHTNNTGASLYEVTRWYKDYLALSLVPQLGPYVNGPNDAEENNEIKGVVIRFMKEEERLKHVVTSKDQSGKPIAAFSVDIDSVNSATSLANGDFNIQIDAKTPGVRERTFLLFNVGETVTVRSAA